MYLTSVLQLLITWPGRNGGEPTSSSTCTGAVEWPVLDSVVLLGTVPIADSVQLQVAEIALLLKLARMIGAVCMWSQCRYVLDLEWYCSCCYLSMTCKQCPGCTQSSAEMSSSYL